jgi:hypothetical protein
MAFQSPSSPLVGPWLKQARAFSLCQYNRHRVTSVLSLEKNRIFILQRLYSDKILGIGNGLFLKTVSSALVFGMF